MLLASDLDGQVGEEGRCSMALPSTCLRKQPLLTTADYIIVHHNTTLQH